MSKNVPRRRSAFPASPVSIPMRRSVGWRTTLSNRTWREWLWWVLSRLVFWFMVLSLGSVVLLKWLPVLITPTMLERKLSAIREGRDSELHYDWTAYERIDPEAALAMVAAEDQHFPTHFGFDFGAMEQALRYNLRGKRTKGASTISQQVAKNVFLWQGRSYFRKGLEAWFTLLIETIWGKKRILEVYLNVAETGPMTFGVEAAAKQFYGHSAQTLSRTEAARIAAVLPNPIRFSVARPSAYVQRRTNFIARQMRRLGKKYLEKL
ncbi:MAG: monofunctional biosynthetic peptidoglycan transglycosylase [Cytophagaceae bacterium]|nr:monofunctional biosynthetic peptidoglycan transglycosylase [Cytophagaceae bacterium]